MKDGLKRQVPFSFHYAFVAAVTAIGSIFRSPVQAAMNKRLKEFHAAHGPVVWLCAIALGVVTAFGPKQKVSQIKCVDKDDKVVFDGYAHTVYEHTRDFISLHESPSGLKRSFPAQCSRKEIPVSQAKKARLNQPKIGNPS